MLISHDDYLTFWNCAVCKILTPSHFNTLKLSVPLPFKRPFYMMNSMHSAPSAPGTPYLFFVTLWIAPWPRVAHPCFCQQSAFNSAAGVYTLQSSIDTLFLQSHLLWQLKHGLFQREPQWWLVTYRRVPWQQTECGVSFPAPTWSHTNLGPCRQSWPTQALSCPSDTYLGFAEGHISAQFFHLCNRDTWWGWIRRFDTEE